MKSILFLLGVCSGYVPDDLEMTDYLCQREVAAQRRVIAVTDPYDDFERSYFDWGINRAVGRK